MAYAHLAILANPIDFGTQKLISAREVRRLLIRCKFRNSERTCLSSPCGALAFMTNRSDSVSGSKTRITLFFWLTDNVQADCDAEWICGSDLSSTSISLRPTGTALTEVPAKIKKSGTTKRSNLPLV